jgi:hypothetical protein
MARPAIRRRLDDVRVRRMRILGLGRSLPPWFAAHPNGVP